ncbi:MAG: ABC transporter permease [Cyclobacteriaceae bacterium]
MLRNYLTLAFRLMRRQWTYAFINIFGLAVGIACSLVILLYVVGEWSYESGFDKADRIYRIGTSFFNLGKWAPAQEELLVVLPAEYAGIEAATRVNEDRQTLLQVGTRAFPDSRVLYTDSVFFRIFNFGFLTGDPNHVLSRPQEMVVTEEHAQRLFGHADVVGETIAVGKDHTPYTITGVIRTPGFNTMFRNGIFLSNHGQLQQAHEWTSLAFQSFVLLREGQSRADLDGAITRMVEQHVFPESGKMMGFTRLEDYLANENSVKFWVHNLRDIYLKSDLTAELIAGGNETNLYIFLAVALFILFLAAVNFVNLSTARASRRAREVGIRKVLGTSRAGLVRQHLMESLLTSFFAMVLAIGIAEVFLELYRSIRGDVLFRTPLSEVRLIALFALFSAAVGLLSGLYPAFVLSGFSPVKVLKGVVATGGSRIRSGLVVFQFTTSLILIIAAFVIQQQIELMQKADLGFDQENVVTIDNANLLGDARWDFLHELESRSGVVRASGHTGEPGSKSIITSMYFTSNSIPQGVSLQAYPADDQFLATMNFRLLKGRNFSKELASDSAAILLNERAVAALGLTGDPVGQTINDGKLTVVGVVKNFHWESLRNEVGPAVIMPAYKNVFQLSFKLNSGAKDFLKAAEARWKELVPGETFKYHFLNENFEALLKEEQQLAQAINFFTILAIILSCLGLYGLAAFTAEQRTREIGIRKVLGATVGEMLRLLSKEFMVLVVIAFFIASPVAMLLMYRWLEGFAVRSSPGPGLLLLTFVVATSVALLTIGYHTWRTARANPTDSLRAE